MGKLYSNFDVHECVWFRSGLRQIHALSIQANYELRIDLEDFENSTAFAQYDMFGVGLFSVDPEDDGYPLTIGDYTGTA
ncbi:fibrinogen C domain-containing protein 1, partial [Tachysurus ichikawai]